VAIADASIDPVASRNDARRRNPATRSIPLCTTAAATRAVSIGGDSRLPLAAPIPA